MKGAGATSRAGGGRLDLVCGGILAAASLYLFVHFVPTHAPGDSGPGQIAPSFIPRLALAVTGVCGCMVMAGGWRSRALAPVGDGGRILSEMMGWALFSALLLGLLSLAGFVVAGVFGILAGVALTRYRRRPLVILLLAIGLPLLLDWAVWQLFWIELP